jgi:hypothetical protein
LLVKKLTAFHPDFAHISEMCAKVVTNGNGYAILKGKRGGVSRCGGDTAARRANILLSPAQKKDSAAERCRNKG